MPHVDVIAEVGVNHDGDIEKAFRLIDVACAAGADIVKFQTFDPEFWRMQMRPWRNIRNVKNQLCPSAICCRDWRYRGKTISA